MKRYSIGLALTDDEIVLIKKETPSWQKGMLNFVGGKIEDGETALDCIVREFREETGVSTVPEKWRSIGRFFRNVGSELDFVVYIFGSTNEKFKDVKTTTNEEIKLIQRSMFENRQWRMENRVMSNLPMIYEFFNSTDFNEYPIQLEVNYESFIVEDI